MYCQLLNTRILSLYGKNYLLSNFHVVIQELVPGTTTGFFTLHRIFGRATNVPGGELGATGEFCGKSKVHLRSSFTRT